MVIVLEEHNRLADQLAGHLPVLRRAETLPQLPVGKLGSVLVEQTHGGLNSQNARNCIIDP